MSLRNPISCLFFYQKKAYRFNEETKKPEAVFNVDGSHRANDNYISFLQVISFYWEPTESSTNPNNLNIFLNGGSTVSGRDGERQYKNGYTVVLPQFLGERFVQQFSDWSAVFGITSQQPVREYRERSERRDSPSPRGGRSIKVDEFVDPSAEFVPVEPVAVFEP